MSEAEALDGVVEAVCDLAASAVGNRGCIGVRHTAALRTALKDLLAAHDAERDARAVEDCYNPRCSLARHAGSCYE